MFVELVSKIYQILYVGKRSDDVYAAESDMWLHLNMFLNRRYFE
ncbi:protein of unknown function [Bartonella clarridgeiae 73]|uniref:Uncharacterized protein n=1 Tax=Bartonella clarridgeiae (strain CCUG 45776 / CIP 104772 / 73) TaxID=696125 RepID=E6YI01_BARC7|nr:MAG: hypothetical protein PG977_000330 [Bartonella clarridgeiae]CBI76489.1 protein of unknown function [Bartonella clarridgeiae 73]